MSNKILSEDFNYKKMYILSTALQYSENDIIYTELYNKKISLIDEFINPKISPEIVYKQYNTISRPKMTKNPFPSYKSKK